MKAHLVRDIGLLLLSSAIPAFALTPSEVFEKVKDSVLVVKALDAHGSPKSQGSGVMLPNGKVATNCHVVRNGERFQVGRGKEFVSATLHAADSDKDLCLLEVNGLSARPAILGQAVTLKIGQAVYAVGSPKGLELSLSDGIVSQLRGTAPPIIQTTTAISPGSSGGGLFDAEGRLVGITTFYLEGGQSLNFALPVEWLANIQPGKKKTVKGKSQTDWLARGTALWERDDWQGLLDWSQQWPRADPGNAVAWAFLGSAHNGLKRYTDAIEAYRQSLRIEPDFATAWYNLGGIYVKLNRYTDAIEAYREVVRIKPDDPEAWYGLGAVYVKRNRYTDAIDAFHEAVRIKPDHAEAWNNLAVAYTLTGNRAAALEAVQELRRYDPGRADMLFNKIVPK